MWKSKITEQEQPRERTLLPVKFPNQRFHPVSDISSLSGHQLSHAKHGRMWLRVAELQRAERLFRAVDASVQSTWSISPLILKCSPCSLGSEVLHKNAFLAPSLRWLRRQASRVSLNLKAWGRLLGRRVSIFRGAVGECAHFCWQVWVGFGLWGNVFQKL